MQFHFPKTVNSLDDFDLFKPKRMSVKMEAAAQGVFEWIYTRSRLSEAQNHRCCWCKDLTTEERNKKKSSTIEHFECKSLGGSDDFENLIMSCNDCNQKRKTFPVEVFLDHIQNGTPLPSLKKVREPIPMSNRGKKKMQQKMLHKLRYNPQVVWC